MSQDKHRATDAGAGGAAADKNPKNTQGATSAADKPDKTPTADKSDKARGAAEGKKAPGPNGEDRHGAAPPVPGKKGAASPAPSTPVAGPPRASRAGPILGSLSLLLTLAVIGGGYNFWRQYDTRQQQLDQHIAAVAQTAGRADQTAAGARDHLADLQSSVASLKDSVHTTADQLSAKVDGAVGDMQTREQALQDSVQKVHDELQRNNDGWIAAEAEYLIRVANQRLQLTGDTKTAMQALENADSRLHDMGDPSLLDVRKRLADDIVALRAVAQPDITGMSLTLTGLSNHVTSLPLAGVQAAPAALVTTGADQGPPATGWHQYLNRLWAGLRQLVVIRHQGDTGKPMLTPDERVILRQNLRLQLEAARVALLRGDDKVFRDTLATAGKWLNEYFDTAAQPVTGMQDTLKSLQTTDLNPQMPDLSDGLKALRAWEAKHAGKAGAVSSSDAGSPAAAAGKAAS